jgi:peptidoglycan/xylan/chitin deacetylase (PgdA/CDA1 family)
MYHRVDYNAFPFFETVIKPSIFERQIRYFRKHFQIIDLNELKRFTTKGMCKKDLVVLTFDDGYRDNFLYAYPILKKYKIPATIFLATDYINTNKLLWYDKLAWIFYKAASFLENNSMIQYGISETIFQKLKLFLSSNLFEKERILKSVASILKNYSDQDQKETINGLIEICNIGKWPDEKKRPMLSWKEVISMSKQNISFGSHTKSHPVLSRLSSDEARQEIIESKNTIEEKIQKPVTLFSYPYGKSNDYSENVVNILREEGFEFACTAERGSEKIPINNEFQLKRKGVAPHPYTFL